VVRDGHTFVSLFPVFAGIDLLRNPKYNKGVAFTLEERQALRLTGLLPPQVCTQDEQLVRVYENIDSRATPLDKYIYMTALSDRNERLFYCALQGRLFDLMPIVYTPTVGEACIKFGHIFRRPRGLFVSLRDKGCVQQLVNNWPEHNVRAIVFTDGERILGLGDLGANGMGIPIGKLELYTACAGLDPAHLLPVTIDVGTDNEQLLVDPLYIGLRQKRDRSQAYDELIDEFITAVKARFGPYTLLQFEDFGNKNAFRLLQRYQDRCCTFNDDIQGTAAVIVAGIISAQRLLKTRLINHTYLFVGAGEAGVGIARLLCTAMAEEEKISFEQASQKVWLVDSKGLVVKDRPCGGLEAHKLDFAHPFRMRSLEGLANIVGEIKPTCLFGLAAQHGIFTEEVCKLMLKNTERPLIFALSNPTSKSECTAEEAYRFTDCKCIFASGSPFPDYKQGAQLLRPGQGNNAYIFPGMALAIVATGARRVPDSLFLFAARALAEQVTDDDLNYGTVYPQLQKIREVSARLASKVAEEIYRLGLATFMPKPDNIFEYIKANMYDPRYPTYSASCSEAFEN